MGKTSKFKPWRVNVDRHWFELRANGWCYGRVNSHRANPEQLEQIQLELEEMTGEHRHTPTYLRAQMRRNAKKQAKQVKAIA